VNAVIEHQGQVPLKPLCDALDVPRSTVHRRLKPANSPSSRPTPERALDAAEKQLVIDVLCSERFVDRSPAEVFHTLLDEG
jgi:putative transposase